MPTLTLVAALLAALFLPLRHIHAQTDSLIRVRVPTSSSEAQTRVMGAMLAEGLSVSQASHGLVQAQGTEKRNTIDVTYSAVAGEHSE